jgi:hypothetical protein
MLGGQLLSSLFEDKFIFGLQAQMTLKPNPAQTPFF